MSVPLPDSDEYLGGLAVEQAHRGDIDAAKHTASRITNPKDQRFAWMGILYAQFYGLKDLRATKETVLSLPDSTLWMGSWVHDLVASTARAGDIEGAKKFVKRLTGEAPRGHLLALIAAAQTQHGDYAGAKATHATIERDNSWRDLSLVFMATEMISRNDREEAEVIVSQIHDPEIKSSAMKLFGPPPT